MLFKNKNLTLHKNRSFTLSTKNSFSNPSQNLPSKYIGLCGTIICYARNPESGKRLKIRALLDSGANASLITSSNLNKKIKFCLAQKSS
jgi:hypothetical protein